MFHMKPPTDFPSTANPGNNSNPDPNGNDPGNNGNPDPGGNDPDPGGRRSGRKNKWVQRKLGKNQQKKAQDQKGANHTPSPD